MIDRALVAMLSVAALVGCEDAPANALSAQYPDDDLAPTAHFDPGALLEDADFGDASWTEADVERYLERTHYGTRSFLADYRSGDCGEPGTWCSAARAVVTAAGQYAVSPRLLLVFAEVEGQLLHAASYPVPSSRVEYAFACGCTFDGCNPDAAGFDVQLQCLAARLGMARDAASGGNRTARGVAVGVAFVTADGVSVTPSNAATAAIYEILPEVAEGAGGAWMVAALLPKIRR